MDIKLYNTLTREKETFMPIVAGKASIYTCGFTVYDYAHIGNLRSYIFADVLKRALMYGDTGDSGSSVRYEVKHIENITDVGHLVGDGDVGEDKMEVGARKVGKNVWEIAKFYTDLFVRDMKKSNVLMPDVLAPATKYIPEQIEFIQELEKKGYAYRTLDGIYFDTGKLASYADFAKLDLVGQKAGARVEENKEKKNKSDFALWKFSPREGRRAMEWPSPWGVGFPGWHIECSAISTKLLGDHFDIHTGGIDHIPVHHTNEVAQNVARYGRKVVNYWLHNNFLTVDGTKMSKSLGNLYTLDDIEKRGFSALGLRYLYLGTHYRQQLNFTWQALESAQISYNKLVRQLIHHLEEDGPPPVHKLRQEFDSAMADDLNTPQALAVLWKSVHSPTLVYEFDKVLGLGLKEAVEKLRKNLADIPTSVSKLVAEREVARLGKDWGRADEIRAKIENLGYHVLDTDDGPSLSPV